MENCHATSWGLVCGEVTKNKERKARTEAATMLLKVLLNNLFCLEDTLCSVTHIYIRLSAIKTVIPVCSYCKKDTCWLCHCCAMLYCNSNKLKQMEASLLPNQATDLRNIMLPEQCTIGSH